MNEYVLKDALLGYIDADKLLKTYEKQIDSYIYSWIVNNYGLYDPDIDTKDQIGRAYIGPNPKFEDSAVNYNWGWYWYFTPDKKYIRITFNTIKNQYLDINEDNVVNFTIEGFINQFA